MGRRHVSVQILFFKDIQGDSLQRILMVMYIVPSSASLSTSSSAHSALTSPSVDAFSSSAVDDDDEPK